MMLATKDSEVMWQELPESPADSKSNMTLTMEIMQAFADQYPTAIAPLVGHAMRSSKWKEFVDRNRNKNIVLVSAGARKDQTGIPRSGIHTRIGRTNAL